jgi:hypothetical protein
MTDAQAQRSPSTVTNGSGFVGSLAPLSYAEPLGRGQQRLPARK